MTFDRFQQTLEHRAIQIKESDIARFTNELNELDWTPSCLLFLDEVSIDNRAVVRRRGYGPSGTPLIVRGEYRRFPRVSMLSFLGVNGLVETFMEDGTFTRSLFLKCCRNFALSGMLKAFIRLSIYLNFLYRHSLAVSGTGVNLDFGRSQNSF